jgi:hypothetical protein
MTMIRMMMTRLIAKMNLTMNTIMTMITSTSYQKILITHSTGKLTLLSPCTGEINDGIRDSRALRRERE